MGQSLCKDKSQREPTPEQDPELQHPTHYRSTIQQALLLECSSPSILTQYPTHRPMTSRILDDFLRAVSRGFQGLSYGIIGGAALNKYGMSRATADIDVIVPWKMIDVATVQVVQRNVGIVRMESGRIG
jgi:hypothetical protein